MKQRIISLAILALIGVVLIGTPVFAYMYRATYTVTSENTTDFEMLGVYTDNAVANQWMADNGFFNSTANDTRIETLGGLDKPHMVTDDKTFTAIPVPAGSQTNLYFTTGESEQDFYIIPGYGGSVNVTDAPNVELGDNFTITQSGWVDTSVSDSEGVKLLVSKPGAFGTVVSAENEIMSFIIGDAWVSVAPQEGDEVSINSLAVFNGKLYGGTGNDGELYEWNGTDAWVQVAPQSGDETVVFDLAVYNGKLYGGTQSDAELLEWNGTDAWVQVAPQLAAEAIIYDLAVFNDKLYGGTGTTTGELYEWNGVDAWVSVAPKLGAETRIYSLAVFNGKLYGGTYINGKLYEWDGVDEWVEVAPKLGNATGILSLAVYNGKLYGGTNIEGLLYEWDGVDEWVSVAPQLGAETSIHSLAVFNGKLYGGTGNNGKLYEWESVSVTATGVESGEHVAKTDCTSEFFGLGVDIDDDTGFPSVSDNLVFGAPLWSSYLSDSPFDSVDATGHTCTVTGAVWSADGWVFGATNDVINCGDDTSLDLTSQVTMLAWIYPTALSGSHRFILGRDDGLGNRNFNLFTSADDDLSSIVWTGGGAKTAVYSQSALVNDNWYLVGVTYDGAILKVWVNGVVGSITESFVGAIDNDDVSFTIGEGAWADYGGIIGEVWLYNEAFTLTPAEMTQFYNDTKWKYTGAYTDDDFDYVYNGNSVPNTDADWALMQNNVMPYSDNTSISVNGTLQMWFRPNDIIAGTTLPDRQGGDNPGTFVWGSNPDGVSVAMGGLVSSAQPSPGVTADDPTPDILPGVEVTDWYIEPDVGVGGTLLDNPFRPFVTIMSDTTTLTELQAWRILGAALWLAITVWTAMMVRGHHAITGFASAGTVIGLVALTIYPMWAVVFSIAFIIGGLISERTPSL